MEQRLCTVLPLEGTLHRLITYCIAKPIPHSKQPQGCYPWSWCRCVGIGMLTVHESVGACMLQMQKCGSAGLVLHERCLCSACSHASQLVLVRGCTPHSRYASYPKLLAEDQLLLSASPTGRTVVARTVVAISFSYPRHVNTGQQQIHTPTRCLQAASACSVQRHYSLGTKCEHSTALARSVQLPTTSWLQVCKCWLGFWGMSKTLQRPAIEAYVLKRELLRSLEEGRSAKQRVESVWQLAQEGAARLDAARGNVERLLAAHVTKQGPPASGRGEGGNEPAEVVLSATEASVFGRRGPNGSGSGLNGTADSAASPALHGLTSEVAATAAADEGGAESVLLKAHHEHRRPMSCGEGKGGLSELVMMLADTEEAAAMFLDAFENASKAAAVCAQAAEGMLGLLWEGFLMRPNQLEQAHRLAAANPAGGPQQESSTAGSGQGTDGASAPAQTGTPR